MVWCDKRAVRCGFERSGNSVKTKEETNDGDAVSGKNGRQELITDAINEEYRQIMSSKHATAEGGFTAGSYLRARSDLSSH